MIAATLLTVHAAGVGDDDRSVGGYVRIKGHIHDHTCTYKKVCVCIYISIYIYISNSRVYMHNNQYKTYIQRYHVDPGQSYPLILSGVAF